MMTERVRGFEKSKLTKYCFEEGISEALKGY